MGLGSVLRHTGHPRDLLDLSMSLCSVQSSEHNEDEDDEPLSLPPHNYHSIDGQYSLNTRHSFESRFSHSWRGPTVIRLLKVGPAAAKCLTSPNPTVGPALSRTGGK